MKGLRWYLLFLSHYGLHTLFHLRNTIIHADSNITSMSGTEIFIPDHLIFCQLQRVYVTNANCLLHPSPVLPVLSTVRHQVKDFITTPVQQLPREEPLAATRKHPTGIRVCWLHMENNPGWGITVIAPKKKKSLTKGQACWALFLAVTNTLPHLGQIRVSLHSSVSLILRAMFSHAWETYHHHQRDVLRQLSGLQNHNLTAMIKENNSTRIH